MTSFKIKTIQSIFWIGLYYIATQFITLIINIVLARLLPPENFGLVAMAMTVISSLTLLQGLGLNIALIQWSEINDHVINTAFFLIIFISLGLVITGFIIAPVTALFFNNSQLTPMLWVLLLGIFIDALGVIPATLLDKELEFRRQLWPTLLPLIIYGNAASVLALLNFGAWSIVWARIIQAIIRTWLVWYISPWRPKRHFEMIIVSKLLHYGKDITLNSILIFIFLTIDNVTVGKVLGEHTLGLYAMAFTWANLPATMVTSVFGRILFPTLSKLQNNPTQMGKTYLKTLGLVTTITLPVAVGLSLLAKDFIATLYPSQWFETAHVLKILAFYGLFRSIGAVMGPVFMASGRQRLMLKIVAGQVFFAVILIYPVTVNFGLSGTALLLTTILLITILLDLFVVTQIVNITIKDYITYCFPQILAVIVMAITVEIIQIQTWLILSPLFTLFFLSFCGFIVYSLILYYFSGNYLKEELAFLYRSISSN